jgi:peptide chain release factor
MSLNDNIRWIQLTSGQGPEECELAVSHALNCMLKEATHHDVAVDILENVPGIKPGTYQSVMLSMQGDNLNSFIQRWKGTIQWTCESPYRPTHKRKNWFIAVNVLTPLESHGGVNLNDLKFETMRASGAGGQHVNTTDSAVRVIHVPTGLTAFAQEERSQYMNKKLAITRLNALIKEDHQHKRLEKNHEKRNKHSELERRNPTRVFVGAAFKEKHK